jgi:hypothetical protein
LSPESLIQAGGNLTIKTTGDTRLEGTNLAAGGAAAIEAGGKLDFAAAKNTASSSSQQTGVDVGVTAGKTSGSSGAGVSYSESKSSLNQDVAGSIQRGSGALTLKSGGDASFTGTQLSSQQGEVTVAAGGALNFNAARTVESSSSVGVNVSASAAGGKKENVGGTRASTFGKKTGGETMDQRSGGASVGVGVATANSDTATGAGITSGGGAIKLSSGGNTTLEGTQVKAANGVLVEAGGSVIQKEAVSTSSAVTVGASASASGSSLTPQKKTGAGAATATPSTGTGTSPGTGSSSSKPPAKPPPPTPNQKTASTAGAAKTTGATTGTATGKTSTAAKTATTTAAAAGTSASTGGTAGKPAAPATVTNPNQQKKGSGVATLYVDVQNSNSSQATTIDGGAGGVVIKQNTGAK